MGACTLQVFVTNFGPEVGASPTPWVPVARDVRLQLKWAAAAAPPPRRALMRRIDDNCTAPFDAWAQQGSPDSPTPAQLAEVHAASEMSEAWVELDASGQLAFTVPPYGVVHLTFE